MTELRHRANEPLPAGRIEGHFGLALDKLAAMLDEQNEIDKNATLRRLMGHRMTGKNNDEPQAIKTRPVGETDLLKAYHTRMDAFTERRGCRATFETLGPLAIGLGNSSPLENGITIHATYGVPYLPGSAIKGMVGSWAEHWCGLDADRLRSLFGRTPGKREPVRRGAVTFLDALPLPPAKVTADVMTPHAGPYYADQPLPPADWHSPNPIPFIAVPEGQRFVVRFLVEKRGRLDDMERAAVLDGVELLLADAFATIGIGAKTAAGYGRLERID